jgi:hypothetical protein
MMIDVLFLICSNCLFVRVCSGCLLLMIDARIGSFEKLKVENILSIITLVKGKCVLDLCPKNYI